MHTDKMLSNGFEKFLIPELEGLTPREYDVLQLCTAGLSNKEIANYLGVSVSTIKLHLHNLLMKYHEPDRERLALVAIRLNLIEPNRFRKLQDVLNERDPYYEEYVLDEEAQNE